MEIISIPFALSAIAASLVFYLLKPDYRNIYLVLLSSSLIASYSFYLLLYVIVFSLINYYIGLHLPSSKRKILLFRIGIIFNILQIIVLKYASFAVDPILNLSCSDLQVSALSEIVIPVGISYFTLQAIGYLVNIKMGWEKPEHRIPDFLLYIIFFPKFLSGPIERSNHFLPQVKALKSFNEQQVTEGLKIAFIGFFKKVVIANQLGVIVTGAYSDIGSYGSANLWAVFLLQPLYLYFDFSGYTDIAIGFAKMFGIDLLPNFQKPFLSVNVSTFWKKFHMSLSLWFNDYVFKQVSFRYRKWGKYAAVLAVFVTFTLFGIWHGAGWHFMLLGFIQALAINFEFFTKTSRTKFFSRMPEFSRRMSGRLLTYLFFGFSLVFFFSPNLEFTWQFFLQLFLFTSGSMSESFSLVTFMAVALALIFILHEYISEDCEKVNSGITNFWNSHRFLRISVYYLMTILIMALIGKSLTFVYQAF